MTPRSYANFEEKLTSALKKDYFSSEKRQIFIRALGSLKIGTLMGSICPKWKRYDLKIYRGVKCHLNEEQCKTE